MALETAVFVAAKALGLLVRVETWIAAALVVSVWGAARRRRRVALASGVAALTCILALSALPVGDMLLQPLERQYPANPALARVDGILVLGGGEDAPASAYWRQPQLGEGGDRLTAALALARRHPDARVVLTGGSGAVRDLVMGRQSEAGVAAAFFREQGLPMDRLEVEDRSRNTEENARRSLTLAKPAPGEVWVLVTSAFHMPRAMRGFQEAGWRGVVPYPVDYRTARIDDGLGWDLARNLRLLNTAIREWVGAVAHSVTG